MCWVLSSSLRGILWVGFCSLSHFTVEKTEALLCSVPCSRSSHVKEGMCFMGLQGWDKGWGEPTFVQGWPHSGLMICHLDCLLKSLRELCKYYRCLTQFNHDLWGWCSAILHFKSVLVAELCLTLCDPIDLGHQAPLSMEFSRQEYWRGLPFPSPGDLPNPGIKPRSPAFQVDSLPSEPPGKPQPQISLHSNASFRILPWLYCVSLALLAIFRHFPRKIFCCMCPSLFF